MLEEYLGMLQEKREQGIKRVAAFKQTGREVIREIGEEQLMINKDLEA
jgi:hypothetical protein